MKNQEETKVIQMNPKEEIAKNLELAQQAREKEYQACQEELNVILEKYSLRLDAEISVSPVTGINSRVIICELPQQKTN